MSRNDSRNQVYALDSRDLLRHQCEGPDGLRTFDCVMFDLATERPGWQAWCRWWWRYDGRESGWLGWGRPVLVKANRRRVGWRRR